jgi:hypothetical protein
MPMVVACVLSRSVQDKRSEFIFALVSFPTRKKSKSIV